MCGFGQSVVLFIVRMVEGRGVVDGDVFSRLRLCCPDIGRIFKQSRLFEKKKG